MAIKDAILPEFDHEMATAATVIERVPEDKFGYKPHEKSMTMGALASHIADMPTWAVAASRRIPWIWPAASSPFEATSNADLLAAFDKNVAAARTAIAGASDDTFMKIGR